MKKLLSTLIFAFAGLSGAWAQQDAIKVSDYSGFLGAMNNPNANIVLEEDIDFNDDYCTFDNFHGTIDGKGHSIKNFRLNVEDNGITFFQDEDKRHALIQYAEGATFKNLTLDNMIVKHDTKVACLVRSSKDCTYEKVYIKNSEISAYNTYVGGLVYESEHDKFINCTTDENTRVSAQGSESPDLAAYAGGLVGKAKYSTFTDCVNRAEVSGCLNGVGGIVASDNTSYFTRCVNFGYVYHNSSVNKNHDNLGGIVAQAIYSDFVECVNIGKLFCEDANGGGIVGSGKNVSINNCLNTSQELMFSKPTCGAIIGYAENSKVASCLSNADYPILGSEKSMNPASGNNYRLEISNHNIGTWEMGVSKTTMISGIVARWLNNSNENRGKAKPVWYQYTAFNEYPHPANSKVDPYDIAVEVDYIVDRILITKASELKEFAEMVNNGDQFACAVLANDIDLSSYDFWTPIGNSKTPFRGIFDGKGHTISGLRASGDSNDDGVGLFGVAGAGAEIREVTLADNCMVNNTADGGAAGILGRVNIGSAWGNVVIENCGNYALVNGNKHAGAILGRVTTSDKDKNVRAYINQCFNMGKIHASESNSGLLCGYAQNSGYITNSWAGGVIRSWNAGDTAPYDSKNPSGEKEYFAGYDRDLFIANCFAIQSTGVEKDASQVGVEKLDDSALTSGEITYKLNGFATEGNLRFYQQIGKDTIPMLSSSGGDIVYAYIADNQQYYTNDKELSTFYTFGPIRVKKDNSLALLDGDSKSTVAFDKEIAVGRAELKRKFKANVPSTLMLPFSAEIGSENHVHLFTFEEMQGIIGEGVEYNDFLAVMKEVEDGKIEAYTPYLAMFDEDTDVMVFNNVTLKPAQKAVTERGDWCFVGQSTYREITLDDFYSEDLIFYGYTGKAYDGFKLGEFVILSYGASIAPFRCYLYYKNTEEFPVDIDVVTKKAPTRAMTDGDDEGTKVSREDMPEQIQIVLKGANGETGIGKIDTKTGEFTFEGWYDLNGNRVEENYQGVRVGGGKKVIVK